MTPPLSCFVRHSEITAFLASLSKILSVIETGLIPPNVNLSAPNPAIRWDEYGLCVPLQILRLPQQSPNRLPLIAMSSSGIGGANGHAVVEGPPQLNLTPRRQFWRDDYVSSQNLLVIGGLSPRSAASFAEKVKDTVSAHNVQNHVLTYGRNCRSMTWRTYATYEAGASIRFLDPVIATRGNRALVFVFSGQGPQHFESESPAWSVQTM
jgi:acyl transferase domain-containing protein